MFEAFLRIESFRLKFCQTKRQTSGKAKRKKTVGRLISSREQMVIGQTNEFSLMYINITEGHKDHMTRVCQYAKVVLI